MTLSEQLRKYLVMGSQDTDRDPAEVLDEAIQAGITAFQYREKGRGSLEGEAKLELGRKLRGLCRDKGILFIVNDDLDMVEPLEADGVHVGQEDISVEVIRSQFPDKILGLSVSTEQEIAKSSLEKVDYLGAGPVFQTSTKEDAKPVVGIVWIKQLREAYRDLPIVGIGGINTENASSVIEAGAAGVAVVSAITHAESIAEAVKRL
ncbi:thiamine-phosphate diphosphorylase [Halobacillus alkaliphilus]|uniref:Thiamine-phosphate synthase n=1 Tax=Halobacillus alkaliphilus TaxID=396056 RepID=A0A1I2RYB6_9BACI|nr:thiamine phosphate synthase [Halobacillus alkaliphilus]SFG43607.1 thiamine-phosphate diphosphorylase [Halobacillus alkaliphilus]